MNNLALGPEWLDPQHLAQQFGILGILAIVFAECGLLVGFFLPGDSLLFAAGLLVSKGTMSIALWELCALISLAAIAGNICGYVIGRKAGPRVFNKPESRFFSPDDVEKTAAFFARWGGLAIVLARFVPIVRTFTPVLAGTSKMDWRPFVFYSVLGGILWGTSMTVLGYFLGRVEFIANNIDYIVIAAVLLSLIPGAIELRRRSRRSRVAK